MSQQYLTAQKGTVEFDQLITGTFSKTQRALPVQNLRVGAADEVVTFEVVDLSQIPKLSLTSIFREFLPTKKLLFVLFPVFYFCMRDFNQPKISATELIFMISSLVLSLLAVQIQIDIRDFISGYDRIRGVKGQRILQKGFRTVWQLESDFKKITVAAAVLGVLPLVVEPRRIFAVVAATLLFAAGYRMGIRKQNRLNRDLALSVIAGPCLAYGILPVAGSLLFGLVWSFFVFFVLQLEHFQHYFAQTEAGEKNLITLKSFDQAPTIIWWLWGLSLLAYVLMRMATSQLFLWIGSVVILIILSFKWRKSLFTLQSPAGSEIEKIVIAGYQLYYTFIGLWVVEILFQALIAPLVFAWFR